MDSKGEAAGWTGEKCFEWAGHLVGEGYSAQGNILAGEEVVTRMAEAFESTKGPLGRRLIQALRAGEEAGGDRRGKQSAALLVVREAGGYDHPNPIQELERLYDLHEQTHQGGAYIRLGVLALKKGKERQAQDAIDHAIEIAHKYPENANLLNSIAWELAINEFRLDDVLELARKAVELAPKDGNIWDTLGEVYARRGNYREAVKAEEKAVALSQGNKEFQEKLEKWRKMLTREH